MIPHLWSTWPPKQGNENFVTTMALFENATRRSKNKKDNANTRIHSLFAHRVLRQLRYTLFLMVVIGAA